MRNIIKLSNSLLAGAVLTMFLAAGTGLYLMATTSDSGVKKTGLFGSIFFESIEQVDGNLTVGVGVERIFPLLVIFLVLSGFILLAVSIYSGLRARRKFLDASRAT